MRKIITSILLIFLLLIVMLYIYKGNISDVKAVKGVIDFSNYDFDKKQITSLDGQWELYNNELLEPQQLENRSTNNYLTIPNELKEQFNGQATGYMTLRLKIKAEDTIVYGFRIKRLLSASKVWVNGILQGKVGTVGKSYNEEKAIYLPTYSYFTAKDGNINIVIQTSNYRDLFPVIRSMEFGKKDNIMNQFLLDAGVDLVIIGALLILQLLNLSLFVRLKYNKAFLYFSILCLFVQLRCLFLNERIIVRFFPNMPYELLSKTAALTYYLWVPIYVIFIKEIFKDLPPKLTKLSWAFSLSFTIICLMTNNTFYDSLSYIGEAILAIIIISMLIFLINKVKVKERHSEISFVAFFFIMITSINDIFVNNGVSYARYGFQVGMFIFAILEAYMLTVKYSEEITKVEKLKSDTKVIYEQSIRDGLTNVFNRGYIEKVLDNVIDDYKKYNNKFSVLMIDIDHFKSINDNFGHPYGDKILIEISGVIKNTLRSTDYIGRYGGEEFIIILPNTSKDKAKELAECIRDNIKDISLENGTSVTVSGGLYENNTYMKQMCIEIVDRLLYKAKNSGRNKIIVE
ncbi:diguanylate cyclase [Clostridium zeae]|uniref:Diguanylate cyclase n=1 Tax=Clostridium zeae TaxID=2759022 RepID=A0ABQ1EFH2_9CLOT|nr:diguanylate cyclase [Clostridium zeae]GFZ33418.1 diguanylate cyclase [Clostridium zeae]